MNKKVYFSMWGLLWMFLTLPLSLSAQTEPRWTKSKVMASMNADRSNDTYELMNTESFGPDVNLLRKERFTKLIEKIAEKHGLQAMKARVDTLKKDIHVRPKDFTISFAGDSTAAFQVKLIDEYEEFADNIDQTYDWTLYQLFAVSKKDVTPVYDTFEVTKKYNSKATVRSIIPGLGQLYKGHKVKAYTIWGLEGGLLAATLYFNHKQNHYGDKGWRSKSRSYRQMRNLAILGMGVVYAYNLLDAAISKAATRVVIKKVEIRPSIMDNGAGLAMAWGF